MDESLMPGGAVRVLLVEDSDADARLLRETLGDVSGAQFALTRASTLETAIEGLGQQPFDVILLDLDLPDSRGLDTVKRACRAARDLAIVVLTGSDDEAMGVKAVREGAQDYLVKGHTNGRLLPRAIRYAQERKRAQIERERLIQELQAALGDVKRLSGLLPICASCKKIRDGNGNWEQIETYIDAHSEATFTHGLCPECARTTYADVFDQAPLA